MEKVNGVGEEMTPKPEPQAQKGSVTFAQAMAKARGVAFATYFRKINLNVFFFHSFADERDAIQKKTFTKWVNKHLKKVRRRKIFFLHITFGAGLRNRLKKKGLRGAFRVCGQA